MLDFCFEEQILPGHFTRRRFILIYEIWTKREKERTFWLLNILEMDLRYFEHSLRAYDCWRTTQTFCKSWNQSSSENYRDPIATVFSPGPSAYTSARVPLGFPFQLHLNLSGLKDDWSLEVSWTKIFCNVHHECTSSLHSVQNFRFNCNIS